MIYWMYTQEHLSIWTMWFGISTHERFMFWGWYFCSYKGVFVAITAMPTRVSKAARARFVAEVEYMKSLANERICASCAATYWLKPWLTRPGPNLLHTDPLIYIYNMYVEPCNLKYVYHICMSNHITWNPQPGVYLSATLASREEYNRLCETSKDCKCEDSDSEDASEKQ